MPFIDVHRDGLSPSFADAPNEQRNISLSRLLFRVKDCPELR